MKAFIYITIMLFTCIESYSQKELIVFDNGTKAYKIKGGDGWVVENENGIVIVPKVYKLLKCYGNFIYCKRNISNGYCELYDYNGIPKIGQSDSLKNLSFVKLKNGWIMQSSDFKFSSALTSIGTISDFICIKKSNQSSCWRTSMVAPL
jgi:hypothetical protein